MLAQDDAPQRMIVAPPKKDSTHTIPTGSTIIPPFGQRSALKVRRVDVIHVAPVLGARARSGGRP
eukprot:1195245-Prorocentrum_minimum.AAC.3